AIVRPWALDCPAALPFERVLPMLTSVADRMNGHLPPRDALRLWAWLEQSKCGRTLTAEQKQWILLFAAVAMRDAEEMANAGPKLLERYKNGLSEATEYAFLASVAGLACQGKIVQGQELMR